MACTKELLTEESTCSGTSWLLHYYKISARLSTFTYGSYKGMLSFE
jgi:hypothetical protein